MPRAATRTPRASRRTGSTAPASTAWSNASRALCWAPASMPQHRARAHAAHPGAAPARLQTGALTTAQHTTSTRSCTAQRSSSGASPCCRSFVQCSVRAAQRQADPWHAQAVVRRRPAERVRAASAAMSPAAASEQRKEAAPPNFCPAARSANRASFAPPRAAIEASAPQKRPLQRPSDSWTRRTRCLRVGRVLGCSRRASLAEQHHRRRSAQKRFYAWMLVLLHSMRWRTLLVVSAVDYL